MERCVSGEASGRSTVAVTGGAGYIGSHVVHALRARGTRVVVIDDLSQGFADALPTEVPLLQAGIDATARVTDFLRQHAVGAVMHFASRIQVGESVRQPGPYYLTNVAGSLALLQAMQAAQVQQLIFSSTAAIFGQPQQDFIDESHPQVPINPYGRSKWLVEQLLADYEQAYGLRSVCLRYFNAAGAHPDGGLGERHDPETHLIPLAIRAALSLGTPLQVFGDDYPTPDGTCVRDYIHVCDLADAHIRALDHLQAGGPALRLNLGHGVGSSVRAVLQAVAAATGRKVPHAVVARRPGDPAVLVANATQAQRVLGWRPRYTLADMVVHAVAWHRCMG